MIADTLEKPGFELRGYARFSPNNNGSLTRLLNYVLRLNGYNTQGVRALAAFEHNKDNGLEICVYKSKVPPLTNENLKKILKKLGMKPIAFANPMPIKENEEHKKEVDGNKIIELLKKYLDLGSPTEATGTEAILTIEYKNDHNWYMQLYKRG